jgi:hypothetical protein
VFVEWTRVQGLSRTFQKWGCGVGCRRPPKDSTTALRIVLRGSVVGLASGSHRRFDLPSHLRDLISIISILEISVRGVLRPFMVSSFPGKSREVRVFVHSVRSLRTVTPYGHSVRSLCSFTPYGQSVRSLRTVSLFVHSVRSDRPVSLFVHSDRSFCSFRMYVHYREESRFPGRSLLSSAKGTSLMIVGVAAVRCNRRIRRRSRRAEQPSSRAADLPGAPLSSERSRTIKGIFGRIA